MRRSLCVRAAATVGLAIAGYMAAPQVTFGVIGIVSAEAAQFYTRKRVNGVWITGQFPKGAARAASPGRRSLRYGRRSLPAVTAVPASAALARLSLPDLRPEAGPSTTGSTRSAVPPHPAALPDIEAALVTAAVGPVAPFGAYPAQERGTELRRALEKRANEMAAGIEGDVPSPPAAGPADLSGAAPPGVAPPEVSIGAAPVAAPEGGTGSALVPRSVLFDFETGIKTTVFEASVVKEPFDVAAIRGLTARPLSGR